MANSISSKITVVSGINRVISGVVPFSGPIASMIVSNDLDTEWEIFLDKNLNDLSRAVLSLSASSSGGTLSASTYYNFRVTTVDANGVEGPPSTLYSKKTVPSATSKITVSWPAITDASLYRIYASSLMGQETLVSEQAGLTFDLTTTPPNAPFSIPTLPDFNFLLKADDIVEFGNGCILGATIAVFARVSAGGTVTFCCVLGS